MGKVSNVTLAGLWANNPDLQNHFGGSFEAFGSFASNAQDIDARFSLILRATTKYSAPTAISPNEALAIWIANPLVRSVLPNFKGAASVLAQDGVAALREVLAEAEKRAA